MGRKLTLPDDAPAPQTAELVRNPLDPRAVKPEGHVPDTAEEPPDDVDRGPEAPVVPRDAPTEPLEGLTKWFAVLKSPPRPEMVGPLGILLVMAIIARRNGGVVKTDEIFAVAPRGAVEDALRHLRLRGYIRQGGGGGDYTIEMLPVELPA